MNEAEKRSELAIAANLVGRLIGCAREAVQAIDAAAAAGDEAAKGEAIAKAAGYAGRVAARVGHSHLKAAAEQVVANIQAGTDESIAAAGKGLAELIGRLSRIQHAPHAFVGMD